MKAKPKKVDWRNNLDDIRVVIMGKLGLSTKAIIRDTGFTPCQVAYRLSKASVRRLDFRNGESNMARIVLQKCGTMAKKEFLK